MKVFISWSGTTSEQIALALRDWLPFVLPFSKPYVSAADIEKGTRPLAEIAAELQSSSIGILCVTPENASEPWIHFEAGALSKAVAESATRVCPLLFGMRPADLDRRNPLNQFQATAFGRDEMLRLIRTIAKAAEPEAAPRLEEQFDVWWPRLESSIISILSAHLRTRRFQTVDDVLRQLSGESTELPEGIVALKWCAGATTLDIVATDESWDVLQSFSLQVLGIQRWSEDRAGFVDTDEISEKGSFAPLTLHVRPVVVHERGWVSMGESYRLARDAPLTFLFLRLESDHLEFGGQRGSSIGTHVLRTAGTYRVSVKSTLRGTNAAGPLQFDRKKFLFFRWDGASTPVPGDPPIGS